MVKVEYKKVYVLEQSKVRQMCIDYNFYTCGDTNAYYKMFSKCNEYAGEDEKLREVAWDIVDHSDIERLESFYEFDTIYDIVAWVMTQLANNCVEIIYRAFEVEE